MNRASSPLAAFAALLTVASVGCEAPAPDVPVAVPARTASAPPAPAEDVFHPDPLRGAFRECVGLRLATASEADDPSALATRIPPGWWVAGVREAGVVICR